MGFALLSCAASAWSQEIRVGQQQIQATQAGGDPIRQLNLTAEQVGQIRVIREQNKDERFRVNQRLRQAQRAMDEAINADNPSETLIEQRARELAEAQTAAIRMRALTEVRIRRFLTPEQLAKLRMLRQQALNLREQRLNPENQDQLRPRQRLQRRQNGNQRDGILRPNRPRVQGPLRPVKRP
ncbi:MAG: Spy/CpxP family protein refolding chaperone [Verrucomicrobiaceae bacterium]|nr:Spy/CpxP family protein refolding chaperone [Verrucomicrobiaceae bacterium]